MTALILLIFLLAFALVWLGIWHLLKDPEVEFFLESKAAAHEPALDEKLLRIQIYLHEEEKASLDEISSLLAIDANEASALVGLLVERGVIGVNMDEIEDKFFLK